MASALIGSAGVPTGVVRGTPEVALSRVAPNPDGTHPCLPSGGPNGICYIWKQGETFSSSHSAATFGTNTMGITTDGTGTWGYNLLYGQFSGDMGSILDSWIANENAVMVYETFSDQSVTGKNYTMIFEDQIEGDSITNFGNYNAQNAITPINDPVFAWGSIVNRSCGITIGSQTTGFEVPALFDGYGVYKSQNPITRANQGTFMGDAILTASGYWQYIDTAWLGSGYYAVRVKWDGGTYPFVAPLYSYGMSNDVTDPMEHWRSYATGPAGSSVSAELAITYQPDCGCFGYTHLFYSDDDNATWHYIGTDPSEWAESGYWPWTAPGSGEYWWYAGNGYEVNVCDDPPGPGTPAEAGPYVIGLPGYNIPVVIGWNLISFPLSMSGSPETVLEDMGGDTAWSAVKYYQSASKRWCTYRPGSTTNDLGRIDNTMGLWIYITNLGADKVLRIEGTVPDTVSVQLLAGWNLVGYPSLTTKTVAVALSGTGADSVAVFKATRPDLIREVGTTYKMTPGQGYWVHVNADAVWTVDW